MRKLATVREISDIKPIDGADRIELAIVDGWQVVIKKDDFKPKDKIIYIEIDGFLPIKPQYEFLRKSSYKVMADGTEGFRLRSVKLRGQISQGLIIPLNGISIDTPIGTDVTDELEVRKYEAPIPACISGDVLGKISGLVRKTDQERIQNLPEYFTQYATELFEISEKLDGSSMSCYDEEGDVKVCGHQWVYAENDKQTMWKIARRLEIPDRIKGRNIALQGECIGEGIQSNKYKIIGQDWRVFDIWDLDKGRYMTPIERMGSINDLNRGVPDHLLIKHVPIIEESLRIFDVYKTMKDILAYSVGKSAISDSMREGLVCKSHNLFNSGIVSFKLLSNSYLLENE